MAFQDESSNSIINRRFDAAGDPEPVRLAVRGDDGDNVLRTGDGVTIVDGGAGADTMYGGAGDNLYVVDNPADAVDEAAAGGLDSVRSSVSYALPANVEELILTGSGAINGTGNELANRIAGNGAANVLSGGGGADTLLGGAGDDIYAVDDAGVTLTELPGEGNDLVQSSVSFVLAANIERLTLTGSSPVNGTGNTLANLILGNSGANVLSGEDGNDTLDGGGGADTLAGGPGDDMYIGSPGEATITEIEGEGTDLVRSALSYTLGANLERLTLTGASPIEGTGNLLFNRIVGNEAANTLRGNAGGDTLDGGAGADTLIGGNASDVYVVDDAGDVVSEVGTTGTDWVLSSVSFTLPDAVEYLTLTGSSAINATGNGLANLLLGNAAANVLDGLAGTDTMKGGAGDATYIVDTSADRAVELAGAGSDSVFASATFRIGANVENLTLTGSSAINGTGNAGANLITGNDAANVLVGMGGADTLQGGLGNDSLKGGTGNDELTGGDGADVFFFVENPGPGSADVITDFASGADRMRLDDARFTAIGALGSFALTHAPFVSRGGLTGGQDADDRIVYNSTTGALYYDSDGSSATAGLIFATLQGAPALAATDFSVM